MRRVSMSRVWNGEDHGGRFARMMRKMRASSVHACASVANTLCNLCADRLAAGPKRERGAGA